MAKKRLATVEEAILVHLLGYKRFFDEQTVPLEMTQAGISRAIGVRRSHVSSSLDSAKGKGKVEEELAHIKGQGRRRKCYFLTYEGMELAVALKDELGKTSVSATLSDGGRFKGKLEELYSALDRTMPLARLALLTFGDVVNLPVMDKEESGTGGDSIPETENFVGREKELDGIGNFFKGAYHLLTLRGMAGVGKTALMAHAARTLASRGRIFWYDIGEWSSPRNTANHVAVFLQSLGRPRLNRYLDAHEVPDQADLRDILLETEEEVVFIFDDLQNASTSMSTFLKMMISVSETSENIKLVLVGRETPSRLVHVSNIEVAALSHRSCLDLLQKRGFTGSEAQNMAEKSGGHPLYLTLIESSQEGGHSPDVSTLLAREIFTSLKDKEKELLHALSVFREPVGTDAFVRDDEDLSALENLEKRSIVRNAGGWVMHALLRDFFYSRQARSDRESRHESAAEYYNSGSTDMASKVEEAHHLFRSGDFESAMLLFTSKGQEWLRHGFQDEILQLSNLFPAVWEDQQELFDARMLKASALDQIGEWEAAEKDYYTCLDIAKSLEDVERRARVLRKLGAIHYRKGELESALDTFESALSILHDGPPRLMAEIHNSIGVAHWRLGNVEKAREAYEIDLRISEEAEDPQGLARSLNNIGILDWQENNPDTALERYARALDLAQRISDRKMVAVLYSNIADVYKSKGEKDEARKYYQRCLELAEDLRFNWQVAEAYRGMAQVVDGERSKYLRMAFSIFESLGAKEDAKTVKTMME